MKRLTIFILALSLVGVMALGFTAQASAEELTPLYPGNGGGGNGGGGGGNGRGAGTTGTPAGTSTGVPLNMSINLNGALDDYMTAAIADGLGINVDELIARQAAGETLVEIGLSLGFDTQAVLDLRDAARIAALNQAVADGILTAEQADWMISRMDNRQGGFNSADCTGDPATCTQTGMQTSQKHMRGGRFANQQ